MARVMRRVRYQKNVRSTRRLSRMRNGQSEAYDQDCDLRTALDALAAEHGGYAIPGDAQADTARGVFGRCYSFPDEASGDAFVTAARALHASVAVAPRIP